MALAGAYVLAEEIARATNGRAAFEAYERRLKPTVERQQRAARRLARWFVPADEFHLRVRNGLTTAASRPFVAAVLRHRLAADDQI